MKNAVFLSEKSEKTAEKNFTSAKETKGKFCVYQRNSDESVT